MFIVWGGNLLQQQGISSKFYFSIGKVPKLVLGTLQKIPTARRLSPDAAP
jgi:hypothetical protein